MTLLRRKALVYIHKEEEAKALLTAFIKRNARMFKGRKNPWSGFTKSHTHLYNFVILKTDEGVLIPALVPAKDI